MVGGEAASEGASDEAGPARQDQTGWGADDLQGQALASYGFRPGRNAQQAVLAAQQQVQAGYRTVVDVDLEKFFDRVNHDILMDRLAKRIVDKRVLRLIRRYLQAGILVHGVCIERQEGTPQGGLLSPLLANVLLDEVDRELQRRGHRFVRYADDCNVYVGSRRAGERVLGALRGCYAKLALKVNESKTAVGPVWGRKFLGYCFQAGTQLQTYCLVAHEALVRLRERLRRMTARQRGRSVVQVVQELQEFVPGWKAYFRLASSRKARLEWSWTNGYATACGRCNSSNGSAARPSTGSCADLGRPNRMPAWWRPIPAVGGATAQCA